MLEHRTHPTWALQLGGDLPSVPEAEILQLLGSIVADFEHPLHELIPNPRTEKNQDLKDIMTVEDGDFRTIANGIKSEKIRLRLTEAVRGNIAAGKEKEQLMSAETVITRTIKNHPQLFDEINTQHGKRIRKMIQKNARPNTPYAFMIVGIKTAIDPKITKNTQVWSQVEIGLKLELSKAFAAAGIPVPASADIDLSGLAGKLGGVFTNFTAKGERIFAVQYRIISIQKRIFREDQTKYGDLLQVSDGIYGEEVKADEEGSEELRKECQNGDTDRPKDSDDDEEEEEGKVGLGGYPADSEPQEIYFVET